MGASRAHEDSLASSMGMARVANSGLNATPSCSQPAITTWGCAALSSTKPGLPAATIGPSVSSSEKSLTSLPLRCTADESRRTGHSCQPEPTR